MIEDERLAGCHRSLEPLAAAARHARPSCALHQSVSESVTYPLALHKPRLPAASAASGVDATAPTGHRRRLLVAWCGICDTGGAEQGAGATMAAAGRSVRYLAALALLLAACTPSSGGTAPAGPAEVTGAPAVAPAPRPVRAAYVVLGSSALPAWLAQDEGIFARYGLDVELTYIAGQVRIGEALVGGDLDVGIGPAELAIAPTLEGADLAMVASWNNRSAFSVLVLPGVQTVADLQGKRVGVTRRRSLSETWATTTLGQFGLVPERDYSFLAIGGQAEQLAALQAGAVDAAVLTPPTNLLARQLGFFELLNYRDYALEFAGMGLNTTRRYLKEQPETLDRLLRALAEGVALVVQQPELAVATLGRQTQVEDRELLAEAVRFEQSRAARDLLPTSAGLKAALDEVTRNNPRGASASPDDFVDLTLVRGLNESGFIASLYP
jgi:ABC-type nitrate/sulfonate/bicarbonate transport system substrate-binding protein